MKDVVTEAKAWLDSGDSGVEKPIAIIQDLLSIVERLPVTADGVRVVLGMTIYEPPEWKPYVCYSIHKFPGVDGHNMYADCYSTREAAEAASGEGG